MDPRTGHQTGPTALDSGPSLEYLMNPTSYSCFETHQKLLSAYVVLSDVPSGLKVRETGYQGWLRRASSSIAELKRTRAAPGQLQTSVQWLRHALQRKYTAIAANYGFARLPNELLQSILFEAQNDGATAALKFGRVCRRFYGIIIESPVFWTHITTFDPDSKIKLYLQRSKNVGLTLEVINEGGLGVHLAFLKSGVLDHCHRWESLAFFSEPLLEDDWRILEEIYTLLRNLHLPKLRHLALMFMARERNDANPLGHSIQEQEELMHFCDSWTTPRLQVMECENLLPRMMPSCRPTLTKLTMTFNHDEFPGMWTPKRLLHYLSLHPSLVTLEIRMLQVTHPNDDKDELCPHTVHLPQLRELHITTTPGDLLGCQDIDMPLQIEDLQTIMHALHIPALSRMSLLLGDRNMKREDFCGVIARFFKAQSTYALLEELSLTVLHRSTRSHDLSLLWPVLSELPSLRRLTIRWRRPSPKDSPITYNDPVGFSGHYWDSYWELPYQNVWTDVKTLCVGGCEGFTQHDMVSLREFLGVK